MCQDEYAYKSMPYWIDEQRETIFCLIEAPDKKAVEDMHGKAHGFIPGKIIEVRSTLVESENEELIREHAKKGGLPANSIVEVATTINPATAKKVVY